MKKIAGLCLLTALACGYAAFAQETTGSIVGTVVDPTGAGVPNAKVTITNTDRNAVIRIAESDAQGNYSAPLLPIGHYTAMAEVHGFKKAVQKNIEVNVNDKLTVNITLEVGDVQQEVTVEASPLQVELQTPASQTLITGNQIRELSLNARNYEQLVALMPGVSYTSTGDQIYIGVSNPLSGQSNQVTFAINGGRTDQNNWTVDGADNVDRGANLTLLNYPSVDAIAEFRVLRANYSAEFGRNVGGTINVITKSGANQVHGDAYEFFRNNVLAANNYFNNAGNVAPLDSNGRAKVPPLRYNNFGYTVGGPVYIPGIYKGRDKTFFFFSEEFHRVITYTSVQGTGPTADEKKGIFAVPVCLAFSGSTCTASGTQVTNIDPVSAAYIKDIFSKIPDATSAHVLNLSLRNVYNARQELIKLDHMFSAKWQVSGRYVQDAIPTIEPRGLFTGASLPDVSTTSTNSPGRGVTLHLTGNLKPNLVNEAGYAYSYGAVLSDPTGYDASANSPDIKLNLPFAVTLGRIPTMNFGGVSAVTGYGPYRDYNRNHQWFDNLTKIAGAHTLKVGISIDKYQKRENAAGNNVGSFTFATTPRATGGNATTQGWANFLLGNVSSFTQVARDITPEIHQNQVELYAQDEYRVRRNLTLSLGVRYSLYRQPTDANGYLNTFDPAVFSAASAPQVDANGNLVANTGNLLNGQVLACKTSQFGCKISNENYKNFAPRLGFAWDPFSNGKTSVRGGYGIVYDTPAPGLYESPITGNPISVQSITYTNTTFSSITSGTVPPPTSPPALTAFGTKYDTPYVQQWSIGVERELFSKTILDVSYVGSKGTHLFGEPDINDLPPGFAGALGLGTPTAPLTTSTDPKVNAYRPFRGYRSINMYQTWFNSHYNALQATFKRDFAENGFIGANFTYAKALTNAGTNSATPQNFYNRQADYGFSPYDRHFIFGANWNYELPFFRHSEGILKYTLGGWQHSGILSVASGLPFNASDSSLGTDPGGLGILGSGSGATPRGDQVCNPNAGAPHLITQWFNTQCFTDVPAGQVRPGNADRNSIRGPGYQVWDLSLFKNFHIKEKANLQFRAESFNSFNHTNWSSIGATLGSSTYGTVTAARDARVVQFGLKLYY